VRVKRSSRGSEDENRGDGADAEHSREETPRNQASTSPGALRDPKLAHERCALERRLGVAPLGGLDERVQEEERADEPEKREHCQAQYQPLRSERR
jgi:hypothetical protein